MKVETPALMGMFYQPWTPPKKLPSSVVTRVHRILDDGNSARKEPVHARLRILQVLDEYEWKTIEQIAKETTLTTNTVAMTTDRMRKAGTIERSKRETIYGKVNVYRKK